MSLCSGDRGGFGLGSDGTIGITGEWQDRGRSDRSEPAGSPRIIGDSKVLPQLLRDTRQLLASAWEQLP